MTQALPGLNNLNPVYNQLYDVLTAGLRRQILLGVCASAQEESHFHQQLQTDVVQRGSQILTIQWHPEQPQLLKAIAELLVQYPAAFQGAVPPTLVISNIAALTQSAANCQQRFLRQLRSLADHITDWNFNLLLWVNGPWLHQLQQAAPEFWRWHTGVFWLTPTQLNPDAPEPAETAQARIALQGRWEQDFEVDSPAVTPPPNLQQALQQYRERLAQGDKSLTTLNQAIQTAEALITQSQDTTAEQQNDLGNFYWLRSRSRQHSTQPEQRQKTTQDLLRALHYYEQALTQIGDPQSAPQTYAMIQNNLGAAYGDMAHHDDPVANLQRAIQAYETSLQYRTPEAEPTKYSATQNNRGTAYWHLSKHQDTEINLEGAIAAYLSACAVYEQRGDWSNWAMLQNNLGTTYWQLAQQTHESGHLSQAIACYQQSLRYRTAKNAPAAYAATQNNIAAAQWHLASLPDQPIEQVQQHFDAAIAAYTEAAQVARQLSLQDPPVFVNFDFLAAYHNLGVVHYQLATETRFDLPLAAQQEHLHASVQAYCQALQLLATDSESFTSTLMGLVQSIRACYERGGITGQNEALQQVPGILLPHLLPQLSA